MAGNPILRLLSEFDALAPLAPSLIALASAMPRALTLAKQAVDDTRATDALLTLADDTFETAVGLTMALWKRDDLLVAAGVQLRDALTQAGENPQMRASLVSLRGRLANVWDQQLERTIHRAFTSERGDLSEAARVAQAVTDRLLERVLT